MFYIYFAKKIPVKLVFGGDTRIRTGDQSFADSCLTTWLYRRLYIIFLLNNNSTKMIDKIKNICSLQTNIFIILWSGKRGSNP